MKEEKFKGLRIPVKLTKDTNRGVTCYDYWAENNECRDFKCSKCLLNDSNMAEYDEYIKTL